jgi:hypothetical protein
MSRNCMQVCLPFSTCPPYVSHPPSEMAETWRPERPRNLYSILGSPSGGAILNSFERLLGKISKGIGKLNWY